MDPARLRAAPASYAYLRGLLMIPGGLLILLAALGNWAVGPFADTAGFVAAIALLAAAAAAIQHDYNKHYGRLSLSQQQQAKTSAALIAGIAVVGVGSLLLRSRASWSLDLPVNPIAVTFAAVMLISYAAGVGIKIHHLLIWGAVMLCGALPIWHGADPSNIALTIVAGATIVDGLLNHRLFVLTFGPRRLAGDDSGA
jgi:hypothetical protein